MTMTRFPSQTERGLECPPEANRKWRTGSGETWWTQHREASLNWLALGLLLAAWNAADNGAATGARRRPEPLRGYSHVSVRAVASLSP
jgi:hypothetical protein